MASGNRGFAQGLTPDAEEVAPSPKLPPRTSFLHGRGNRITELATGDTIMRQHELVDPAVCRIWEGHNRDYAALDEVSCADLIESFKAQRRQEVPAIVRRMRNDERWRFEVICGARRHWTATWMRAHGFPDFRFLVEPRELTDEEAFRVADLENRSRRDLSDFERARDYARAVELYYSGNQTRMCERLEVSNAWLSRYLVLARLPAEVLNAFGSPHFVKISHAAALGPLLNNSRVREGFLAEAAALSREQRERIAAGQTIITPQAVVQRLSRAAKGGRSVPASRGEYEVRSASGDIIARGERASRGGGLSIAVPSAAKHTESAVLQAVSEILHALGLAEMTGGGGTQPSARRRRSVR
jgi:ParB family transcriptional regulator, chromosome partitioning protein